MQWNSNSYNVLLHVLCTLPMMVTLIVQLFLLFEGSVAVYMITCVPIFHRCDFSSVMFGSARMGTFELSDVEKMNIKTGSKLIYNSKYSAIV